MDRKNHRLTKKREEDVTKTMYRETLNVNGKEAQPGHSLPPVESKVNSICKAFIQVLDPRDGHIQNSISAYVCQNPPNLDAGLREIANMRGMIYLVCQISTK